MKFEIKSRWNGAVLFSLETESLKLCVEAAVKSKAYLRDADLSGAYLRGAYLRDADLSGAYLRGAYLRGAYLSGADLSGAYLSGADLSGADLSGADLSGADLSGADLRDAYLRDADLSGADLSGAIFSYEKASPEEVSRLDAVREIILKQPDRLDMGIWHGTKWNPTHTPEEEQSCGTPHCLAGWLQALSSDEEIRKLEAQDAGEKLAPTASKLFFTSNEIVMDFLKNRRYAEST